MCVSGFTGCDSSRIIAVLHSGMKLRRTESFSDLLIENSSSGLEGKYHFFFLILFFSFSASFSNLPSTYQK